MMPDSDLYGLLEVALEPNGLLGLGHLRWRSSEFLAFLKS
jgi:hypothetical protein